MGFRIGPVPATDTFPLADRLVPEGLAKFLAEARNAGESYETIAARLRAEHDIPATSETARKWCIRVGAVKP